jgi:hypothetical protein
MTSLTAFRCTPPTLEYNRSRRREMAQLSWGDAIMVGPVSPVNAKLAGCMMVVVGKPRQDGY